PRAICYVPRSSSLRREYRRKVRTMARGLRTLWYKRTLLNPRRHRLFAWILWSHKLCRWLVPWRALSGAGAIAWLAAVHPWAAAAKHNGGREQHDLQVLQRRTLADVLEIVVEFFPDIVHAAVVRPVDLGPARYPRQDALTLWVFTDLVTEVRKNRGLLRARPHDVHIANQHVPQLGQLVKPQLAQHASNRGHPRIVRPRPDLARCSVVDLHRAQLV